MTKMQSIEAHKNGYLSCYFIQNNIAVSTNSSNTELFCWEISDMKNWKKLFSVQLKNQNCLIHDSYNKLKGLLIDK